MSRRLSCPTSAARPVYQPTYHLGISPWYINLSVDRSSRVAFFYVDDLLYRNDHLNRVVIAFGVRVLCAACLVLKTARFHFERGAFDGSMSGALFARIMNVSFACNSLTMNHSLARFSYRLVSVMQTRFPCLMQMVLSFPRVSVS